MMTVSLVDDSVICSKYIFIIGGLYYLECGKPTPVSALT